MKSSCAISGCALPRFLEGHHCWRGFPSLNSWTIKERGREENALCYHSLAADSSSPTVLVWGSSGGEQWHPLKLHHFAEHAHRLCDISQVSAYNKGLALSERPTWCLWPFAIGLGISLKTLPDWARQNFSRALQWKHSREDKFNTATVASPKRESNSEWCGGLEQPFLHVATVAKIYD